MNAKENNRRYAERAGGFSWTCQGKTLRGGDIVAGPYQETHGRVFQPAGTGHTKALSQEQAPKLGKEMAD